MDVAAIIKHVAGEIGVIAQVPVTFFTCLIFLSFVAWAVASWRYGASIDHLEQRIKLRDDQILDYKNKLNGASPDEAEARIKALEALTTKMSAELKKAGEIDLVKIFEDKLGEIDGGTY